MEGLPYLCRFQYAGTAEYLTGLTDPLIAAYQARGEGGDPGAAATAAGGSGVQVASPGGGAGRLRAVSGSSSWRCWRGSSPGWCT